tara:strand:- start:441 stop:698 length:258 start_codon:yes stop_codon:yes gene_type:complete
VVDGVEEDLLEVQKILDLVELVDLVVAAVITQEEAVLVILAVLLQILTKDLLEELDINLDQNMEEVAVVAPVVLVKMPLVLVLIQ